MVFRREHCQLGIRNHSQRLYKQRLGPRLDHLHQGIPGNGFLCGGGKRHPVVPLSNSVLNRFQQLENFFGSGLIFIGFQCVPNPFAVHSECVKVFFRQFSLGYQVQELICRPLNRYRSGSIRRR